MVTVAQLAAKLLELPAELQDAPVAVYSETDEGGDIVSPLYGTDSYIVVQRASEGDEDDDDEEEEEEEEEDDDESVPPRLLYYKADNPVRWRNLPVLVTIIG